MVKNFGVSFGTMVPGVTLITGVFLLGIIWWWIKTKNWRIIPIIVGGGFNFYERCRLGYVTDYWRIPGTNIYNNINDWLITVGVGLLLWQLLKKNQ